MIEPQHRFCRSADGTEIAYARLGEGPHLVAVFPHLVDFESSWNYRYGNAFLRAVSAAHTYIHYDQRGSGLSQRTVDDLSLEAQVADLEAVLKSEGIDQFDAFSILSGAAPLASYAARNPGRVRRAVFWSPYHRCDFRSREKVNAMIALIRDGGWSIARRTIADASMPSGPSELAHELASGYKKSIEPGTYAKTFDWETRYDVTDVLPALDIPALVLHPKDSRLVPTAAVRSFAALLPQAELMLVNGGDAMPWTPQYQIIAEIDRFLGGPEPAAAAPERGNVLATVLFTDLVAHTEMMSRLGDERGRAVLREHETITRNVLKQYGGTEVKTMGDGFMASFGSVTKAVECAIALQRAFADREGEPLSIRVGLNAGEPIEEDGDLFGATVILASRIAAKAGAGEILVADTVRGLCSGKGFLFADRGEFVAKGFEEPVRAYEVSWRS
ncbi:MAG: adenylate/guanylate cyclase domain-containing protein [Chloroflexota bacterium]